MSKRINHSNESDSDAISKGLGRRPPRIFSKELQGMEKVHGLLGRRPPHTSSKGTSGQPRKK